MAYRLRTADGLRSPVQVMTVAEMRTVLDRLQDMDQLHFDSSTGLVYVQRSEVFLYTPEPCAVLVIELGVLVENPEEQRRG